MKKILLISFLLSPFIFTFAADFQIDRKTIHQHFLEYNSSTPPNDSLTHKYITEMNVDGTWDYVDYKSTRRGGWPTTMHLVYVAEMASSYAHPQSQYYKNNELKISILNGIQHWLDADYKNENWYPIEITAPRLVIRAFLFLEDEIPPLMRDEAWEKLFKKLHMRRTGSNQVIAAEIEIMKAVFYNRKDIIEKAVEVLWTEVKQTTDEGIQADWCFHQHGNQNQMGNYGRSYSDRVSDWAYLLRNTSYALSPEKIEIHSQFLLNGPAWFLWKGKMDLNASGRQYKIGDLEMKYKTFSNQFKLMQQIAPNHSADFKLLLNKPQKLRGQNSYWRSDLTVHREKEWMASLSMSSSRVIGTELCNMENFLGLHLGDGRLLVTLSGQEYHHVAPLWDWNRLPGTTCDQALDTLTPSKESRTKSNFSGVIGDGEKGIATMHYKRNNLKAKKSWFFVGDAIVCLGSGISGQTKGNVLTSIQQSNLIGEVSTSEGIIYNKEQKINGNSWIHHSNIGYYIFNDATIKIAHVNGNWQKCFPTYNDIPTEGDVFSIYIDHGKNPRAGSYAYVIYPNVKALNVKKTIAKSKSKILSNTNTVQAVQNSGSVMAVFYKAGKLKIDDKTIIEVDAPCLLMRNKQEIRVSDPLHTAISVSITINGKNYLAQLPQGDEKGKQVLILQ